MVFPSLSLLLGASLLANAQAFNSTSTLVLNTTKTPTAVSSTAYPTPTSFSPPFYPAPDTRGEGAWKVAIEKARARVATWTLEQKVNITTGLGWQNGSCIGNIAAQPELDFPGLCLQDSPLGVRRSDFVSVFPAGVNAAATFDRKLIRDRGLAMAEEFKGKGIHVALGPMMNPYRAVQGGRNWEGFGGDPYLQGEAAYETIVGMQTPGRGVQAVAKHYIANEQERNRTEVSSNVNDRTLHEVYLAPFLRSIQADVASVMCSYNQINSSWGCQNSLLLNGILKTELGFQGYVMSDWQAQESGVSSANAGLDMTMAGDIVFNSNTSYWGSNLTESVRNGSVSESRVTDMATRILASYHLLEQEDVPEVNFRSWDLQLDPRYNKHINVQKDHYKLIRQIGAASVVLLKNEKKALPLSPSLRSIALIGNGACPPYRGPNGWNNRAGADGNLVIGWGSGTAQLPYLISPLEAIQQRARKNATTVIWTCDNYDINGTVAASADQANFGGAALVFISSDSGEDNAVVDSNYGDRRNISAWLNGDNVVERVASRNKNTIVVVNSVGPILMPWADHPNITAIVWAGLPGQESGNGLADILYGDYNPSGRLPYTIAKEWEDYPVPHISFQTTLQPEHPQIDYSEELLIDYRWFQQHKIDPLYPFGFGLSYTSFAYTNLEIVSVGISKRHFEEERRADGTEVGASVAGWLHAPRWSVEFDLTNSGPVNGCDVPLLFVSFPESAGEPPRVLRGFEKVNLDPGDTTRVKLPLSLYSLSIWDVVSQRWIKPDGEFRIIVGKHADDTQLQGTF